MSLTLKDMGKPGMTMVEKMAKAICLRHGSYSWEPDFTFEAEHRGDLTPEDYRDMARDALQALRDLCPAMIEAMAQEFRSSDRRFKTDQTIAESIFQAAIDAALNEGK